MNSTSFTPAPRLRPGPLWTLLKRPPPANALVEIYNRLTLGPIESVTPGEIDRILTQHRLSRRKAAPWLKGVYRSVLTQMGVDLDPTRLGDAKRIVRHVRAALFLTVDEAERGWIQRRELVKDFEEALENDRYRHAPRNRRRRFVSVARLLGGVSGFAWISVSPLQGQTPLPARLLAVAFVLSWMIAIGLCLRETVRSFPKWNLRSRCYEIFDWAFLTQLVLVLLTFGLILVAVARKQATLSLWLMAIGCLSGPAAFIWRRCPVAC